MSALVLERVMVMAEITKRDKTQSNSDRNTQEAPTAREG